MIMLSYGSNTHVFPLPLQAPFVPNPGQHLFDPLAFRTVRSEEPEVGEEGEEEQVGAAAAVLLEHEVVRHRAADVVRGVPALAEEVVGGR